MSTQSSFATWALQKIEISTSSTPRLYANGRQQVKVEVLLQCTLPTADITDDEMKTCRLIEYRGSAALPAPGGSGSWFSSETDNGFERYPDLLFDSAKDKSRDIAAPLDWNRDGNGVFYKTFYVSTTSRDSLKIGVEIIRAEDNFKYRSNGEGDNGASSPASIELYPIPIPRFNVDSFFWDRRRVEGPDNDFAVDTIDNWYFCVIYNGQLVDVREFSVAPASMIKWRNPAPGDTFASYIGYAQPGSPVAVFTAGITGNSNHRPDPRVRQVNSGQGVVILVRRGDVPFYSPAEYGPCAVRAIDAFGNEHHLNVRFLNGTDRNRIELQMR
ncbi:hypothetical protein [Burkholderia ubonensis]|uniref:hypothetical protein n=1 Tax=Burkholderia ubonensis TaxID=101571 RepID=UPI000AC9F063|nr:hypothetical protein [Burkholderia ubonensis]